MLSGKLPGSMPAWRLGGLQGLRLWGRAALPQNLRRVKQKRELQNSWVGISPHNRTGISRQSCIFRKVTYPPLVGQAEHLACRKRQPGVFAGVVRTHFAPTLPACSSTRRATGENRRRGRVGPVCRFRSGGGAVTRRGTWTALDRVCEQPQIMRTVPKSPW